MRRSHAPHSGGTQRQGTTTPADVSGVLAAPPPVATFAGSTPHEPAARSPASPCPIIVPQRWKKIDALQPFLPARFQGAAEAENDVITMDEYSQRLRNGNA
jgi:hypothetical protein